MARHPRPVTALTLTLTLGALAACSSSPEPQPFAATATGSPSPVATPSTRAPTPPSNPLSRPSSPVRGTPTARLTPRSTARPINTVVPTGGLTPEMRSAIDVVRSFYLAQVSKPSKSSVATMKALAGRNCEECLYEISIISDRATKGQYTLRSSGDPTWGSLLYSLRPSTGPGLVTVRQQYIQPPLALVNRDGSLVGRREKSKVYTSLYVVENKSGKIRSRTDVD